MKRVIVILSALILGCCASFAQTGAEKRLDVAEDTLVVEREINVAADTAFHRLVVRFDTVRYNLKYTYKDAIKFKNDAFWEKMKEPWIGDILKNIFF